MSHTYSKTLQKLLADCLPQYECFSVLQLQCLPTETHPVVTPKPKEDSPLTIKTQHFFALFHHDKVVYALELYVYFTLWAEGDRPADRLIFVSKADTSGYCDVKLSFKSITKTLIEYVMSIDPNYYLQKIKPRVRNYEEEQELLTRRTNPISALRILSRRHKVPISGDYQGLPNLYLTTKCPLTYSTTICLFTRPAPQYLFAESSKNPQKHCLNGVQLLKWWLSILDDILCQHFEAWTNARLQIPGEAAAQIKRHLKNVRYANWQVGDVFGSHPGDLAAYSIPLFPDDPKTRFLRQLVEEGRTNSTDAGTFWTELAERQEFRLSVAVSVMGVKGTTNDSPKHIPFGDEIFMAASKKKFDYIKSYITGEEYDTEGGALEAFANIRDFFSIRLNRSLLIVMGNKMSTEQSKMPIRTRDEIFIPTLPTRKKSKK